MVSVIIPVYNTESYLEECIGSVVNQTYKKLEIIIINDGSTDHSGLICKKWKNLDSRIKYIEKRNEGQGAARNLGITLATGDYIVFVDSDDYIEKDLIEKVYGHIQKFKADICVYVEKQITRKVIECSLEYKTARGSNVKKDKEILGFLTPVLWNKMFSTGLIKNAKIAMSNRICEDLVFNAQLCIQADKICFLDIPLYYYRRIREGNFTTNYHRYPEVVQSINELNSSFLKDGYFKSYWVQLYELSFYIFKDMLFRIKNNHELNLPSAVKRLYPELLTAYKDCLKRWFSQYLSIELQDKNYLLIGSYNLRVIIHALLLHEDYLKEDYGFSSIISLMSDAVTWELPLEEYKFKNFYRKRCVEQDIKKSFYHDAKLQEMDYIVVDLLDEIADLIKIREGCYITESIFLQEIQPSELKNYDRIPFLSTERKNLFTQYVPCFAEKIKQADIPVVVIKNFLSEKYSIYYDESTDYDNIEWIREINQELEWCYQYLLSYLPDAIVVDSSEFKELVFTHEKFPFGCEPVYYNAGYYQRMAINMNHCICNYTKLI